MAMTGRKEMKTAIHGCTVHPVVPPYAQHCTALQRYEVSWNQLEEVMLKPYTYGMV